MREPSAWFVRKQPSAVPGHAADAVRAIRVFFK